MSSVDEDDYDWVGTLFLFKKNEKRQNNKWIPRPAVDP